MQCSQRSVDLASCCLYLYLVATRTTEVVINYFPILFSVNYEALIIACSVIGGVLILALVVCIYTTRTTEVIINYFPPLFSLNYEALIMRVM